MKQRIVVAVFLIAGCGKKDDAPAPTPAPAPASATGSGSAAGSAAGSATAAPKRAHCAGRWTSAVTIAKVPHCKSTELAVLADIDVTFGYDANGWPVATVAKPAGAKVDADRVEIMGDDSSCLDMVTFEVAGATVSLQLRSTTGMYASFKHGGCIAQATADAKHEAAPEDPPRSPVIGTYALDATWTGTCKKAGPPLPAKLAFTVAAAANDELATTGLDGFLPDATDEHDGLIGARRKDGRSSVAFDRDGHLPGGSYNIIVRARHDGGKVTGTATLAVKKGNKEQCSAEATLAGTFQ